MSILTYATLDYQKERSVSRENYHRCWNKMEFNRKHFSGSKGGNLKVLFIQLSVYRRGVAITGILLRKQGGSVKPN